MVRTGVEWVGFFIFNNFYFNLVHLNLKTKFQELVKSKSIRVYIKYKHSLESIYLKKDKVQSIQPISQNTVLDPLKHSKLDFIKLKDTLVPISSITFEYFLFSLLIVSKQVFLNFWHSLPIEPLVPKTSGVSLTLPLWCLDYMPFFLVFCIF